MIQLRNSNTEPANAFRYEVLHHLQHKHTSHLMSPSSKGPFIVSVYAQVQAHVAQTEVDPGAAVAWLRVTDAGMEASPTGSQLIR